MEARIGYRKISCEWLYIITPLEHLPVQISAWQRFGNIHLTKVLRQAYLGKLLKILQELVGTI
jgi:hypothetical protein